MMRTDFACDILEYQHAHVESKRFPPATRTVDLTTIFLLNRPRHFCLTVQYSTFVKRVIYELVNFVVFDVRL
jgi:hypothetical protein